MSSDAPAPSAWPTDAFADRELPGWFLEAPLGIFIHWGAYSVPAWAEPSGELGTIEMDDWFAHNAYAEWYFNTIRIEGSPAWQHHRDVYGGAPYDDFLDAWKAESFDPDTLVALFKHAGADYVVPTTKHHDGITLWDAPGTGDRNTVARGPRRDLVGAIADAVRAAGIRFGVYYSGGIDWHVRPTAAMTGDTGTSFPLPTDDEYGRYAYAHCVDLIQRYRPSVLWNDINWPQDNKRPGAEGLVELFETYYRDVPDGVVNDRWGADTHWDYRTSEYQAFGTSEDSGAWENCRGIGLSFGYNQVEAETEYLDGPALARHLSDCVARGGRLLLNVGPKADGTLPELQQRALQQLGDWMAVAKPELAGATVVTEPATDTSTFVRWLGHEDRLVAVLDLPGARFVDRQPSGSVTVTVPEAAGSVRSATGGTASLAADRLTVELAADRVGPAVVVLAR